MNDALRFCCGFGGHTSTGFFARALRAVRCKTFHAALCPRLVLPGCFYLAIGRLRSGSYVVYTVSAAHLVVVCSQFRMPLSRTLVIVFYTASDSLTGLESCKYCCRGQCASC